MDSNKRPLATKGALTANGYLAVEEHREEGRTYIAVAFMTIDPIAEDDVLCYCYLKSKSKETINETPELGDNVVQGVEVVSLVDENEEKLDPEEIHLPTIVQVLYYTYYLGDISGDESIDIDDVLYLQQFVKKHGKISVNAIITLMADEAAKYQGLYVDTTQFETIFTLVPIDINGDGYIDIEDANALLEHYTRVVVAELPPEADDLIGTKQEEYREIEI